METKSLKLVKFLINGLKTHLLEISSSHMVYPLFVINNRGKTTLSHRSLHVDDFVEMSNVTLSRDKSH